MSALNDVPSDVTAFCEANLPPTYVELIAPKLAAFLSTRDAAPAMTAPDEKGVAEIRERHEDDGVGSRTGEWSIKCWQDAFIAAHKDRATLLRAYDALLARVAKLERLDREAATYVETVICMRTGFTGNEPYVGWKGLGLALTEALDERDRLRAERPTPEAARVTREQIVRAVCPIVKPWMDASDVEPSACKCPEWTTTIYGEAKYACRCVMGKIADAILALLASPPAREGGEMPQADMMGALRKALAKDRIAREEDAPPSLPASG